MDVLIFSLAILFGFGTMCVLALMIGLPIMASGGIFVNKPQGLEKSGFHLFTRLAPGQVKLIVRGNRPVRMIMNTAGKRFARTGERDSAQYWENENGKSEDPTSDINPIIRPWAKWVYSATGLVFTGIYPFQRVYEYELERTVITREERDGESNIVLTVKRDISDHFRTRQFNFPMHITAAESKDKIPLDIIGVAEMETKNPHLAAFGTDRWDHTVINLVSDAITTETKQMNLDQALTANSPEEARRINAAVEKIKDDTGVCGIEINSFRILEINPALDADGLKAIQAEALATQQGKATRIDGKARADNLREINKANAEGGEFARASMEAEALVRAAKAVGESGGNAFLNTQGSSATDPIQASILAELRKLNRNNQPNRRGNQ